jgi:peptidoglycan/LPS O-acetylase OafA/YrhL
LIVLCFFVLRFIPFFNDADYSNYFQKGDQKAGLFYFLIFFPNYSLFNYGSPLYLGQLWTLGVEEFFYLFFPIFIYFIPYKKIPKFLIASGTVFIIASVLIGYYLIGSASRLEQLLVVYADKYRIYSFALGGLAAYYYLEENPIVKLKRLLSKKAVAYGLLLIIFMCVVTGLTFSVMTQQVYSVYFFVLLLALLLSGINPWLLNNRLSVYLGKISYGFYMLHVIAIVIVLKWLYPLLQTGNTFFNSLLIYFFTTVCTILLAIVSWHAFEKYFLRLRNKL